MNAFTASDFMFFPFAVHVSALHSIWFSWVFRWLGTPEICPRLVWKANQFSREELPNFLWQTGNPLNIC